jgi:hypothetical protein
MQDKLHSGKSGAAIFDMPGRMSGKGRELSLRDPRRRYLVPLATILTRRLPALAARKARRPIRHGRLGAVTLRHFGRDQPQMCRCGAAERNRGPAVVRDFILVGDAHE